MRRGRQSHAALSWIVHGLPGRHHRWKPVVSSRLCVGLVLPGHLRRKAAERHCPMKGQQLGMETSPELLGAARFSGHMAQQDLSPPSSRAGTVVLQVLSRPVRCRDRTMSIPACRAGPDHGTASAPRDCLCRMGGSSSHGVRHVPGISCAVEGNATAFLLLSIHLQTREPQTSGTSPGCKYRLQGQVRPTAMGAGGLFKANCM